MSRAIDVERAIEVIEAKQKELCPVGMYGRNYVYGSDREKYDAWEEIIDALNNLPTFTPQNEPLTIEQLREMDEQPVYIIIDGVDPLKMWVLVEIDGADIYLTNNLGRRSSYEEIRQLYKFKLYRRPPERQGDTNDERG